MHRINLLCPTIRRKSRKVGRNEPCPCGRTKFVEVPVKDEYFTQDGKQIPVMDEVEVAIKFKHCHGDRDNMVKANKIQNYLRQHFTSILNKPRKVSKFQVLATKVKSIFRIKTGVSNESTRKF